MKKFGVALGWLAGAWLQNWRPVLGFAGVCLVVHGLDLVSRPTALCAAGLAILGVALANRRRRT